MHLKKVTHLIFDLDGLIIETETAYHRILDHIASQHGKTYSHDVAIKILGTSEQDTAKIFLSELNIPVSNAVFSKHFHKMLLQEMQHSPLMPGAERLIRHLAKHMVPIAVATSSSMEAFNTKTKFYQDLFKLFNHVVCGSTDPEVIHGKPAPDIFLACARRFPDNPDPVKCLVLEDAPNGIQGAIDAGMQGLLVPARDVEIEEKRMATLVINSLNEFQPELFGLPPFD